MVTLQKIAEYCKVSRTTASYVLSGREGVRISEAVRARILETAKRLDYMPNALARSVRRGVSNVIGIAATNFGDDYFGTFLHGAIEEATLHDFSVKVYYMRENFETLANALLEQRVSGVIFYTVFPEQCLPIATMLRKRSIPLVSSFSQMELEGCCNIISNDFQAAYSAAKRLFNAGCKRILFLTHDETVSHIRTRLAGYRAALKEVPKGVSGEILVNSDYEYGKPSRLTRLLGDSERRPDGILCASDHQAYYVLQAAPRARLAVPEDLSLIGIGDFLGSRFASVPLTTYSRNLFQIGQLSARYLVDVSNGKIPIFTGTRFIEPTYVGRNTLKNDPPPTL